jgi:hypothetical protein
MLELFPTICFIQCSLNTDIHMRNILLAISLAFSVTPVAFASNIEVNKLNAQITAILAPYQNQTTSAQVTFDELTITDERVDRVGVHAKLF